MKIKFGIKTVFVVAVCAPMLGSAQPANTPADQSPNRDATSADRLHLGKLERASKIIGKEITDAQEQRLGKVKDLAVDLRNGRIVEVIVATGGVLGSDEQLLAVPPSQFTCDAPEKALHLNVEKEQFKAAPTFTMSDWKSNMGEDSVRSVYKYYGAQPYFINAAGNATAVSTPQHAGEIDAATKTNANRVAFCSLGEVERASKIIGMPIHNLNGERIGKAENLTVDLAAGRVVEVIVGTGGFLGMGDELSAIPPQSFRAGNEANTLTLDTTKEALAAAPHFKSGDWSSVNNPEQVGVVYHSYNVDPYFTTNAVDNTAQNVRDRNHDSLTPLQQGSSQADVDITRQIRREITAADGLSINARNVKIITIDGHVTLRGPVNSDEEKQRIADIATRVASAGNVDNQLQVQNISPTSSAK